MIMPSETMELPSFFSGDERQVGFWKSDTMPDHYASGKSVAMSSLENLGAVERQSAKSFELHQSLLMRDQKLNHSLDRHAVGSERAARQFSTLLRPVIQDPGTRSSLNVQPSTYYPEGGKVDIMANQYENSLFSSSLSELFSRKLRLSSNNVLYGHSVDTVASHFEEQEPFESLEEVEAQTIGNLLPSDDDLFSGMTDKLDNTIQSNGRDDVEELDFFSSVGGLDLGDDGSTPQNDTDFAGGISNGQPGTGSSNGSIAGEHPYGEQPSRTLFVRNINSNVEDSELRALFEQYGDIRSLYTTCKHRGFVMISYYDIRAANNAKEALQDTPLRRRKLDIHFSIPKDNPSEKDTNQGTLVAFNLDASISNDELHQIFGVHGEIKEIREIPNRSQHKFIEFYDVRAAENALRALNRSHIAGKQIKLEPSRPGGPRRLLQQIPTALEQDECGPYVKQNSPPNNSTAGFPVSHGTIISNGMDTETMLGLPSPTQARFLESAFRHGISSSFPNSLSSLLRAESTGNQTGLAEPAQTQGHLKFGIQGSPNFHPHSLPDYYDGLKSVVCFNSPGSMAANMSPKPHERVDNRQLHKISSNGNSIEFNVGGFGSANGSPSLTGHHYSWGNSYDSHSPGMMWLNSPSSANGISRTHPTAQLHVPPRAPPPVLNSVLPVTNHHVGSAPTVNASLWHRRHAYAGESPEIGFHPGSLGSLRISNNSMHSMELLSPNMFPCVAGNYIDLSVPTKNVGIQSHHQRSPIFPGRSQMIPMTNSFDSPNERARSRRNEGNINQTDKKLYELDIYRILRGEDNRTTLMIKNIPNKYTSKMLLAAIDERHKGTYDFIYLPIDFKNKCNVGYAFINMTDPKQIVPFYQAFNGKKWEKFNSEKVASLAYARIQGKAALIAHFQNSSLMNEDKRCRPILFNTDGPNAGDQVPFPMGVNVRTRPGKPKSVTHEENHVGGTPNLANKESSNGDASSGTGKESD
ncbi:protein MEI2-like 4 isoform X2 [Ricinus communis]|uniref:protein MEI2-like 4 isoform X2 n=1 Tax=Ricinus communis TaxID=3988 RepID=UPI00201A5690|nr:protein MEI2-like 4 isoform X2 [Ricinus communis]